MVNALTTTGPRRWAGPYLRRVVSEAAAASPASTPTRSTAVGHALSAACAATSSKERRNACGEDRASGASRRGRSLACRCRHAACCGELVDGPLERSRSTLDAVAEGRTLTPQAARAMQHDAFRVDHVHDRRERRDAHPLDVGPRHAATDHEGRQSYLWPACTPALAGAGSTRPGAG